VKGTDFAVPPGEVFGLLGPNGAGKSTTVGMLTTTIAPSSGRAHVAGFDVAADTIAARRASAVVFQESVLDRALTGRHNLAVHARLWGLGPTHANTRIASVVAAFGLADLIDRPVSTSSVEQVLTWLRPNTQVRAVTGYDDPSDFRYVSANRHATYVRRRA
jgi:ABC-2 type transport system ATP-binding protein